MAEKKERKTLKTMPKHPKHILFPGKTHFYEHYMVDGARHREKGKENVDLWRKR
jgi:hypothetical protein